MSDEDEIERFEALARKWKAFKERVAQFDKEQREIYRNPEAIHAWEDGGKAQREKEIYLKEDEKIHFQFLRELTWLYKDENYVPFNVFGNFYADKAADTPEFHFFMKRAMEARRNKGYLDNSHLFTTNSQISLPSELDWPLLLEPYRNESERARNILTRFEELRGADGSMLSDKELERRKELSREALDFLFEHKREELFSYIVLSASGASYAKGEADVDAQHLAISKDALFKEFIRLSQKNGWFAQKISWVDIGAGDGKWSNALAAELKNDNVDVKLVKTNPLKIQLNHLVIYSWNPWFVSPVGSVINDITAEPVSGKVEGFRAHAVSLKEVLKFFANADCGTGNILKNVAHDMEDGALLLTSQSEKFFDEGPPIGVATHIAYKGELYNIDLEGFLKDAAGLNGSEYHKSLAQLINKHRLEPSGLVGESAAEKVPVSSFKDKVVQYFGAARQKTRV